MSTKTELRSLVERYAELVDQRKFDDLATVFCPDAVLQTGNGRREGLGEIVAILDSVAPSLPPNRSPGWIGRRSPWTGQTVGEPSPAKPTTSMTKTGIG